MQRDRLLTVRFGVTRSVTLHFRPEFVVHDAAFMLPVQWQWQEQELCVCESRTAMYKLPAKTKGTCSNLPSELSTPNTTTTPLAECGEAELVASNASTTQTTAASPDSSPGPQDLSNGHVTPTTTTQTDMQANASLPAHGDGWSFIHLGRTGLRHFHALCHSSLC